MRDLKDNLKDFLEYEHKKHDEKLITSLKQEDWALIKEAITFQLRVISTNLDFDYDLQRDKIRRDEHELLRKKYIRVLERIPEIDI